MSDKLKLKHETILAQFNSIQSAVKDERKQCLEDRRFYSIAGAQWEGKFGEQFENKLQLEVNKVHLSVIRIQNEYRNNRITVDFTSKNDDDDLADFCDGLYRADELDSSAQEAYDNAFEEAIGGGFGAWRLRAEYEDEEDADNDYQRIRIEPIYDADSSVFFDLDAKKQDKSDAKHCFVITSMTPDAYEEEWGDDLTSWSKDIENNEFDWNTQEAVYVAEYYFIEEKKDEIVVYEGIDKKEERYRASELKENSELLEELIATGYNEVRRRKIKVKRCRKLILSGNDILEDCGYIAGRNIPIVPNYGKRWFVDNVERCMGHVRIAKDPQRLKNMQLSKLGELSALSSVEKPIFNPEQVAGHQNMWSEDNVKNYPYMLLNPITGLNGEPMPSGPLGYTKVAQIPPAMAALLQITDVDIKEVLGSQEAGEELKSNISGNAVELVQNKLDMQLYIYMSNLSKAMKRSGEIWLSKSKDVYVDEGRKMKSISKDKKRGMIKLMEPTIGDDGEIKYTNDISRAKAEVNSEVGPSSSTKRSATVKALTGMMQVTTDQEALTVLSALSMMNMEGEGISDTREFFRKKLVRMGAVKPNDEDLEEMKQEAANAEPDANSKLLEAAAQESEANAAQARAKTIETIANAELKKVQADKAQADIEKIVTETEQVQQGMSIQVNQAINEELEQLKADVQQPEILPPMPSAQVVAPQDGNPQAVNNIEEQF